MKGFDAPLVLKKGLGENWIVVEAFGYQGSRDYLFVPKGSETDLASVPRALAWVIPKAGDSAQAAVLHDRCWRYYAPRGYLTYREADGILKQALRLQGVPFILRWLAWTAVRWASLVTRKNGYREWWKDAPLVLLWTALALPIVLPTSALIMAALLPIKLLESVVWGLLKPFSRKKVNPPNLGSTL